MPATPVEFQEGALKFSFGAVAWQEVERYDASEIHKAIGRAVQGTQAVDFVALSRGGVQPALVLIEVKDYRKGMTGAPPQSKDLAKEVAAKVAGTLIGLVAGARAPSPGFAWQRAARALGSTSDRILVVLHIEANALSAPGGDKTHLTVLALALERELAWLSACRVIACCASRALLQDCSVVDNSATV